MLPWLRRHPPAVAPAPSIRPAQVAVRQPVWYRQLGIADTLAGRYEVLVLHVWMLLRLLPDADDTGRQQIIDGFMQDCEASLRETGLNDVALARRLRQMAEGLHGRAVAYDAGLATPGAETLAAALDRNLFSSTEPPPTYVYLVAAHIRSELERLAGSCPAACTFLPPEVPG